MPQDKTPPPEGGSGDPRPYTEVEDHALSLAAELRSRVQRERATVASLRAFLSRRSTSE